jgi:hypothetical protein
VNPDSFQLSSLVVHDVPQPGADGGLILTDAPVPLDEQLSSYFQSKITQSLKQHGLEAIADQTASPIVRDGVRQVLANDDQLVAISHTIAGHLDNSQTRRNSSGLLAVGIGTVDEGDVVAVMKLEREQGVRLRIERVGAGATVNLQFLRDLTLTDKTKVFKASLLRLEEAGQAGTMYGLVSDDQRGREEGAGVAEFFLSTFLGCKLKTNPAKATLDFVLAAEQFINEDVESDERRASYQVALLARMQDQRRDLRPRTFANNNLQTHDRPCFLARIVEHGLDPDHTFEKDTSLAKTNGFRMVFEHGMTLVGSREDLDQRVRVHGPAGINGVIVQDILKRMGGR